MEVEDFYEEKEEECDHCFCDADEGGFDYCCECGLSE